MDHTHTMGDDAEFEFDVAVSFAGEDREFVVDVVRSVKDDLHVFYDEDYLYETWGEDLVEYFSELYQRRARFVVMFVSTHYAEKLWTNVERRAAIARAAAQRGAYILPVRLDDTQLPGLLPTVGYIDARKVGLDGIVKALQTKIGNAGKLGAPVEKQITLVPRSKEDIDLVVTRRPRLWEYLLFGGLLQQNLQALEPKYRDFVMGYSPRNGDYVPAAELIDFAQRAMSDLSAIVNGFERVMSADVQERAFGKPGEPGDVDRISHLAQRIISIYEDLMNWSFKLRGTSAATSEGAEALQILADWSNDPVEQCRAFVDEAVKEFDTLVQRIDSGEKVHIALSLKVDLDSAMAERFQRKLKSALR